MPIPPRYPRAMFIACLAVAGATSMRMSPAPLPRPTAARIERRDAAIRALFRGGVAQAVIVAGRAREAFLEIGAMWSPPKPPTPKLDPKIKAVVNCARFAALIGQAQTADHSELPWVELGENRVTIMWRGTRIRGDKVSRAYRVNAEGREYVGEVKGRVVGTARELDVDRFTEAAQAARDALAQAGFKPSGLFEVRKLKIGRDDDDDTIEEEAEVSAKVKFQGLVATIGMVRPPPIWAKQLTKRPGFSR